ncbi:MAG: hypothetical protein C4333_00140 [Meiothermus sp.]
MSRKIVYNGVEYSSLEQMPPEAQQAYRRMLNLLALAAQPHRGQPGLTPAPSPVAGHMFNPPRVAVS